MISFEDFKKLDLRVAKIVAAERVEATDKLLKLHLDIGGEERQIISGIAEEYSPEGLIGREIVIIANLEPRNFKGIESQGMLLAAESDGVISLLKLDEEVPPGSPVH
ncbi:MAG: Methionine-tRNA ligase [Candidatus Jorgensenbacteria bacterium GW2011_GWA1_48_13]|uniref:Methionine--tRNA ligase n=1 Tax=Candidatus Jorgensenbacteria bacterium GW2011_GWB1_50_10 TaxID=1618665 RepID=A0A0G1Z8N1_9BACT|nr:MAG: Methionine-tRNA ligase [Candidatus Jorgensenbacteria bacterium GW2011_GWA1_48_13]KKW15389.1 MAG: Methionine-tRNA ligase [Candidatus Jorgensenbacteria bacterium GW2011_GWB1_50_10]